MKENAAQIYTAYFRETMRELGLEITKLNKELENYKKLEEELGCSIEIIFKAIKDGIYYLTKDDELEYIEEALSFNQNSYNNKFLFDNYGYYCKNEEREKQDGIYLEDYKKTWWLKEDKSE